jgi:MFS superfamily sulfate permease-like transporter
MSFLNGGFVTKYFSNNMLSSFTISSSILIVFSQISTLLGIKIYDENIPFELVDVIIGIAKQIHKTNWITLVISIISLIVLYTVKRFINEKFKSKLIIPIPIELIVVMIGMYIMYIRCSLLTYCFIIILSLYLNLSPIVKIISYFYIKNLNLISAIIIIGLRINII